MPSEEFMKSVLESDSAKIARGEYELTEEPEAELEEPEVEEPEPAPEDEEEEEPGDGEEEVAEHEGDVVEEDLPDDEGEPDEEPSAEEHEAEDFYLGRFRTREEAERGWEETYRFGQENARQRADAEQRAAELEQRLAFLEGRESTRGTGGQQEYEQWMDDSIERDPERGIRQAIQLSIDTGDQSYAYEYVDRWGEQDPYRASRWGNRLETMVFQAAQQQPPVEEMEPAFDKEAADAVIASTWAALSEVHNMTPEIGRGMSEVIRNNPLLRAAALSADPDQVYGAFDTARQMVKSAQNTPRRIRKSDAEQVAREKREATISTGDGAPQRRSSYPDLTAEEESILAGAAKMGLKRRDEE